MPASPGRWSRLLSARFRKIPERHRPHSPSQRFRALEVRSLLGWSRDLAARVFLVCSNTISNWERCADPLAKTVGSTVKPVPPVRRFADAVRATIDLMARSGFGGEDSIALTLAGAGWTVSARSVRRITARRTPRLSPSPLQSNQGPAPGDHPLRPPRLDDGRHRGAVVPRPPGLPRGRCLRRLLPSPPLALHVGEEEAKPDAARMVRLLTATARVFGAPKYLITDLGGEFRGRIFAKAVGRLGIRQRFASAPEHPRHRPSRTLLANPQGHREPPPPPSPSPSRTWSKGSRRSHSHTTSCSARTGAPRRRDTCGGPPRRPPGLREGPLACPRGRPGEGSGARPSAVEYLDPPEPRHAFRSSRERRLTTGEPSVSRRSGQEGAGAALLSHDPCQRMAAPLRAQSRPWPTPSDRPLPPVQARLQVPLPAYPPRRVPRRPFSPRRCTIGRSCRSNSSHLSPKTRRICLVSGLGSWRR